MLPNERRNVDAGGREVGGIRAEVDRGLGQGGTDLLGVLGDRRQVWMIVSREPVLLGDRDDPFETRAEALEVVGLGPAGALGATADYQIGSARLGRRRRSALNADQLLLQDLLEDEVGARVGREKPTPFVSRTAFRSPRRFS